MESRGTGTLTVVLYYQIQFACVQIRHTPLSGGYCGEVPPLPIPLAQACSWDIKAIENGARIAAKEASDAYRRKKILRRIALPEDSSLKVKKGGYLLSHIALQYHRRKRA